MLEVPLMQTHLEILQNSAAAQRGTGRQNLLTKTTGTYYTPETVGRRLVRTVLDNAKAPAERPISAIDPFCGDGRLLVWLLEEAQHLPTFADRAWHFTLWDCDSESVKLAERQVHAAAHRLGLVCTINSCHGDSFGIYIEKFGLPVQQDLFGSDTSPHRFDIVVTNPPWEVVKPDARDLAPLDEITKQQYVSALRDFSDWLASHFPTSMPKKRFAGWGVNLARVGVELAVRLTRKDGITGIISPSSVCADQASEALRRWLLTERTVLQIAYYPAEARLFRGVDQPHVDLVLVPYRQEHDIEVVLFDDTGQEVTCRNLRLTREVLEANRFIIPLLSDKRQLKVMARLAALPQLKSLHGKKAGQLWTGREMDESNHEALLTWDDTAPYFFKGRMLSRLETPEKPSMHIKVNAASFTSCRFPRLVWRDVSRPSQKRRVQATLIPAGWVTGNSLGVAHLWSDDEEYLLTLLGIVSSLPFEFQVRSMLTTAHVSVGVLREARVPNLTPALIETLAPVMRRRLSGNIHAGVEMEVIVAGAYGLDHEDMHAVMDALPKLTEQERRAILDSHYWRSL